jgi:hypothetical protein
MEIYRFLLYFLFRLGAEEKTLRWYLSDYWDVNLIEGGDIIFLVPVSWYYW